VLWSAAFYQLCFGSQIKLRPGFILVIMGRVMCWVVKRMNRKFCPFSVCSHLLGNLPDTPWRTIGLFPLHIPGKKCPYAVKLIFFVAMLHCFSCISLLSLVYGYNYVARTLKKTVYIWMQHHLTAYIPFTLYK